MKNNKYKSGISLMILVITIIVMLILSSTIILTVINNTPIDNAKEATIKTDFKNIKEKYHEEYANLIFEHYGKKNNVTNEELQNIIPEEYSDVLIAHKNGISYVGEDESIKEIAKDVGFYIGNPNEIIEIEYVKLETQENKISVTLALLNEGVGVKEIEYFISEDGENWSSQISTEKTCEFTDLKEYTEYQVKVVITDNNGQKVESDIYSIITKVLNFEAGELELRLTDENGEEYVSGSATNQNVYVNLKEVQEGLETTYEATGANEIKAGTKGASILKNEGITTLIVTTTNYTETKTREYVVNIDRTKPTVNSISVTSPETGTYSEGQEVTIVATYNENVKGTSPVLKIKFGEGTIREITDGTIADNTITYKYTISGSDYGVLESVDYVGAISDEAGNELTVSNITLTGNKITAQTQSIMKSFGKNSTEAYHAAEYREKITKVKFVSSINVPDGVISWDVSQSKNGSVMAYVQDDGNGGYILTIAGNEKIIIYDSSFMFDVFIALTEIENIEVLDTSNAFSMQAMFGDCSSLTSLDVSSFDTSQVTNMYSMFWECSLLTNLDLSNFNTSKVTDMRYMFNGCTNLTSLDLSSFDTQNVISMTSMFNSCKNIETLDLSNFNTSKVTDMSSMFRNCNKLSNLNLTSFDTSSVNSMAYMFATCQSLTELDLTNFNTSKITDMKYMFHDCTNLKSLDLTNFNTSNVTNMQSMFSYCSNLESIYVSELFDTSNVTNMAWMVARCISLKTFDVSNWNTSNVTDMNNMFLSCSSLTNLDVSSWNTSNVETMASMFLGCSNLKYLDLSNFDINKVTNMSRMFSNCVNLSTVIMIDNPNITEYTSMFYDAASVSPAEIIVDYTAETDELTDLMIETKAVEASNVHKRYETIQSWTADSTTDFHAEEYRTKITKVVFKNNTTVPEGATSWDVSQNQNGRVMAYVEDDGNEGYILTIGGKGKILANENSSHMFYNFTALKEIENMDLLDTSNAIQMASMFNGCSSLTSLNVSNFNTSQVTAMNSMFAKCSSLTTLDLRNFNTSNVISIYLMFEGCSGLTNLDVSSFDTSKVTNMYGMFGGCSSLTSLDVSNFDTTSVVTMQYMFGGCSSLISLDLSNFSTSNVNHMGQMFVSNVNLKKLDLSNFDTSKVTNMGSMFTYCSNLESLDVSSFNTSNVTDMGSMFMKCEKLTTLEISNFDTSNVKSMTQMFFDCNSLTSLDVSSFNTSQVTKMNSMFYNCGNLTSLNVSNFETANVNDMGYMFMGCSGLTTLDLSNFNTSNVTNMSNMFRGCSRILEVKISNFNTSSVTDMNHMFMGDSSLVELDVSSFNTGKVTDMIAMFESCKKLTKLDLGNFDTSNVENMAYMFLQCTNLKELNISSFNTTKVKSMLGMFNVCSNLESLDLTNFDTSSVSNMGYMFSGCLKLANLNVSSFDTSNVTSMHNMFHNCQSLTSLELSNFDTSNVTNMNYMFNECNNLTTNITILNNNEIEYENMFYKSATTSPAQITVNYTEETSDLVDLMIATKSDTSNVIKGSQVEAPEVESSEEIEKTEPEAANVTVTVNKDENDIVTGVYMVAEDENGIETLTILDSTGIVVEEIQVDGATSYSEIIDIVEPGTYTVELLNSVGETKTVTFEI